MILAVITLGHLNLLAVLVKLTHLSHHLKPSGWPVGHTWARYQWAHSIHITTGQSWDICCMTLFQSRLTTVILNILKFKSSSICLSSTLVYPCFCLFVNMQCEVSLWPFALLRFTVCDFSNVSVYLFVVKVVASVGYRVSITAARDRKKTASLKRMSSDLLIWLVLLYGGCTLLLYTYCLIVYA